jgi:hypothetical protein
MLGSLGRVVLVAGVVVLASWHLSGLGVAHHGVFVGGLGLGVGGQRGLVFARHGVVHVLGRLMLALLRIAHPAAVHHAA